MTPPAGPADEAADSPADGPADGPSDEAGRRRRHAAVLRLGGAATALATLAVATLLLVPYDQATLQRAIAPLGWFAPPAFVVVAAVLALLFVPGPALSAASGALFGAGLGTAVSVTSSALTAVLGLLVARRGGARPVADLSGPRMTAFAALARRHGLAAVVLQRLVPGLPDAPFSYLFGLLRLRVWQAALGTLIGSAPRAFAYTALGDSAASRDGRLAVVAVVVWVVTGVLGVGLGALVARRHHRPPGGERVRRRAGAGRRPGRPDRSPPPRPADGPERRG